MDNYIRLARHADLAFGVVFVLLAGYSLVTESYLMMVVWLFSAAISFVSAKAMPARWLITRVLRARVTANRS